MVLNVKGKQSVKKVLKHCITCEYLNAKTVLLAKTADLPNYRENYNHVFEVVGINICGPIYCKKNYSASKEVN